MPSTPPRPHVNLVHERHDPALLSMIDAHDAWESLVLPLRMEDGVLICATTIETLPDAMKLVGDAATGAFRLVIADVRLLEQFIAERYGFEGVDVEDIEYQPLRSPPLQARSGAA